MVQSLAKSPLAWSIGGVGAIAIALIGLAYLREAPAPADSNISLNNLSVSPWQQGNDLGWRAAVAAQTAQSQGDWQQVGDLWDQAIAALESVPEGDADYAHAQAKATDYRGNRAIALDRQASAPAGAALAITTLQSGLAATNPAFTFTPGNDNNTLGRSADGLATVELTGDRATLVLPRSGQGGALTMAQIVYVNQFLALAAPEAAAQLWLLEGLRDVQGERSPTLPAAAPLILSAEVDTLTITVITAPESEL